MSTIPDGRSRFGFVLRVLSIAFSTLLLFLVLLFSWNYLYDIELFAINGADFFFRTLARALKPMGEVLFLPSRRYPVRSATEGGPPHKHKV